MKTIVIVATIASHSLFASVPIRWTVETSRLQPAVFDVVRGETLELEATFNSYGMPLSMTNRPCCIFWQTNGMDAAWWTAPATSSSNVVKATFTPEMDPGSSTVIGFIGSTGQIYRAAFNLRFRHGPGSSPNEIEGPTRFIDFSNVELRNIGSSPFVTESITNGLESAEHASNTYQPKGEYVTESITNGLESAEHAANTYQSKGEYVTESITNGLESAEHAANTYQPKGEYVTESITNGLESSSHASETYQTKGDYLTSESDPTTYDKITNSVTKGYLCTVDAADEYYVAKKTARNPSFEIQLGNGRKLFSPAGSEYLYLSYGTDSMPDMVAVLGNIKTWAKSGFPDPQFGISGEDATNIVKDATNNLATVAHTGRYGDLYGLPDVISANDATNIVKDATNNLATVAHTGSYDELRNKPTAESLGAYPNASGQILASQVATQGAHLNAEDSQFVSTNYDSSVNLPEASVRIKLQDGGTNVWRTIWEEMRRWNAFSGPGFNWHAWVGFHAWSTNLLALIDEKSQKEYAFYDGTTGEVSPDGFFWISQPRIAICAGAAYQRHLDSGGVVWILESNGLVANIGGTTNGYFRIRDEEGNTQFEIVKGDKQTIPAVARSVRSTTVMGVTHWICDYAVTNALAPPVAKFCRNLSENTWIDDTEANCPCNVTWTPGVNTYTLEFWPKSTEPSMFCKAEYDRGGETRIRNVVPTEMQYIILNGTKYGLVPKTINGELVMGLTTGN